MPHSSLGQPREHSKNAEGSFSYGRLLIGLAASETDMADVLRLRSGRFRGRQGGSDLDCFDHACQHVLIRAEASAAPLAAARLRLLAEPASITGCYTGQFYDLGRLAASRKRLLEIGRICIADGWMQNPDILRALLAALTRRAVAQRADMLVGCASFHGADPARHVAALRHLAANHIGPEALRPHRHSAGAVDLPCGASDASEGLREMPSLLRMYLGMGGWVSDHAVCDPDLDTLHVFSAVETARIPPARLRVLHALALA